MAVAIRSIGRIVPSHMMQEKNCILLFTSLERDVSSSFCMTRSTLNDSSNHNAIFHLNKSLFSAVNLSSVHAIISSTGE